MLFPIRERFRELKSNWLYIGVPLIAVLWLAWLGLQTANTQFFPLPVDVSCSLFIAACGMWCLRFSKALEICRRFSSDLKQIAEQIGPDDVASKWSVVLARLGPPRDLSLPALWSRQPNWGRRELKAARQRLAEYQQIGRDELINLAAEDLYALHAEEYARQFFLHCYRLFTGLVICACLLVLTAASFPFNSEPLLRLTTSIMLFAVAATIVVYYLRFDRNPLISALMGTKPGQIEWNTPLLATILPPLLLGLLAMLGQVFPELWSWLGNIAEPLSRSTG